MPKPLFEAAAAAAWDEWRLVVHLIPADPGVVPQYAVPIAGGWAGTQGRDNATGRNATDDLILSRYGPAGGRALETRRVVRGGHGDRAYSVGGRLVVSIKGIWAAVTFGSPWSWRGTTTPPRCSLRGRDNLQGEASLGGGRWLRLYGGSIKTDPAWHPGENAYLEVIEGTRVVRKVSLDHVARDAAGHPIGGRYEPEGITVAELEGQRCAIVGFAVGQLGSTTMNVYALPLSRLGL